MEQLVRALCDSKQGYTQFGGLRPFGVGDVEAEELQEREAGRGDAPGDDRGGDELPVGAAAQDQRSGEREERVFGELRRRHEVHERLGADEDPHHQCDGGDPERKCRPKRREARAKTLPEGDESDHDDREIRRLDAEVRRTAPALRAGT